jgi:monoterpene epsilon-lactone hydrolase
MTMRVQGRSRGWYARNIGQCVAASFALFAVASTWAADIPGMAPLPAFKDDGTITVPSFDLSYSSFASPEARDAFVARLRSPTPMVPDLIKMREITTQMVMPLLEKEKALYPYTSTRSTIGGVPVDTYVPAAGIAPENQHRVLIELHGGAFVAGGGGPGGAVESVPIASVGRIKVIAVDYRMGPENHFPAASEDVAAVYRELLKTYKPNNIGIFGCSAGGALAGETIPWFLKEHLPLPGALGIFCASLHTFSEGDSAQLFPRMGSVIRMIPTKPGAGNSPYFAGASNKDPLVVPAASEDVLKAFPPTLFLTGTRAPDMSAAVQSHLELVDLGVKSQLLLFDGQDHGFFSNPTLPESKRAYRLIARFFAANLGAEPAKTKQK